MEKQEQGEQRIAELRRDCLILILIWKSSKMFDQRTAWEESWPYEDLGEGHSRHQNWKFNPVREDGLILLSTKKTFGVGLQRAREESQEMRVQS
jgi:hypothetical protein